MDELIKNIGSINTATDKKVKTYLEEKLAKLKERLRAIIKKTVSENFNGISDEYLDAVIDKLLIFPLELNNQNQEATIHTGLKNNSDMLIKCLGNRNNLKEKCVRNYEEYMNLVYGSNGMTEELNATIDKFITDFYNMLTTYLKEFIHRPDLVRTGMLEIRFQAKKRLKREIVGYAEVYQKELSSILSEDAKSVRTAVYTTPYKIPKNDFEILDKYIKEIKQKGYKVKYNNNKFYVSKGNEPYRELIFDGEKVLMPDEETTIWKQSKTGRK